MDKILENRIHKRQDGRWCLVYLPDASDSKRRYIYGKTKKEVIGKVEKLEEAADSAASSREDTEKIIFKYRKRRVKQQDQQAESAITPDSDVSEEKSQWTLQAWIMFYLENYKRNELKQTTYDSYMGIWRSHILNSQLGKSKLENVNGETLQQFYNEMSNNGYNAKTVRHMFILINMALKMAVKLRYITENANDFVSLPKRQAYEGKTLTAEEVRVIDADFNTSSIESFCYLTGYFKNETQIFMSATMEKMRGIISERVEKRLLPTTTDNGVGGMSMARRDLKKFEYKIPINYDYIDLYYFEKFDEIPGIIADASTAKEKWLIFVDSIAKGKKLKEELLELTKDDMQYDGSDEKLYTEEDVIFIDARYENDDESKESVEELKEKKLISKKIIITTSVMDNGISFADKELRNIIIMADTQEEFIQMLGRKRQDGKKVKVYICSRDISYFKQRFSSVDSVLKDYDVYSNYAKQVQFPFLWQERVLDDMITNHYKYNSIIKFCYAEKGQIYCNPISIQKLTDLRTFYKTMCEELGKDKHAFLKVQVSWLGVCEDQAKEFIRQTDDHRSEQMRKQLKERLDELLGENHEIELSAKDNIEKVKKNGKLMYALMYFIRKVNGVSDNKIKDLGQNDRPVQVEEFNSCMQEANLEYEMENLKKGVYIIRRRNIQ